MFTFDTSNVLYVYNIHGVCLHVCVLYVEHTHRTHHCINTIWLFYTEHVTIFKIVIFSRCTVRVYTTRCIILHTYAINYAGHLLGIHLCILELSGKTRTGKKTNTIRFWICNGPQGHKCCIRTPMSGQWKILKLFVWTACFRLSSHYIWAPSVR